MIAIDHPDGKSALYTYDAANNVATIQDENHTAPNTTYAYDPANRLIRVTQTLSTASGGSITTADATVTITATLVVSQSASLTINNVPGAWRFRAARSDWPVTR